MIFEHPPERRLGTGEVVPGREQDVLAPAILDREPKFDGALQDFLGLGDPAPAAGDLDQEEPGIGPTVLLTDQEEEPGLGLVEPARGEGSLGESEPDHRLGLRARQPAGRAKGRRSQQNQGQLAGPTPPPGECRPWSVLGHLVGLLSGDSAGLSSTESIRAPAFPTMA